MKHLFLILIILLLISCGNEKIVQLPEIDHSDITKILDVSPAYLFYDETKPDSIELNRKNLISTTNWLVNIDKRLTLEQAIPSIVFIQNKKRDAQIHKNESARNYYTCHYKKINNLGFIDFTDIYYHQEDFGDYLKNQSLENVSVLFFNSERATSEYIVTQIKQFQEIDSLSTKLYLHFDKKMNFQQYITCKEQLQKIDSTQINIDNNEFIY
jgi:hypothetical protein